MSAAILGQEAPTPSLAVGTGPGHDTSPEEVAAQRGVDLPGLRRQVKGDLDAILLKALAKEEARRYASAGELASDLERHLEHRPVTARAGERAYVARLFVRRHRLAVAAASLLVLSLVAGLAATAWQASRAERAQEVAEHRFDQVQELARALLFDVHDAVARLPGATPARHLLVERALVYLDSLRADAVGDLSLQLELADAYERIGDIQGNPGQANLGDTEAATESYRAALALRLEQPEEARRTPDVWAAIARTHHRIGEVLWWTGDVEEAARQLDLAIAEWKALAAADPASAEWPRLQATSLTMSGRVLSWNGENDAALERYAAAERLLTAQLDGDGPAAVAEALALVRQGRGETLSWMGETDRAIEELERARRGLAELSARAPLDTPLKRRLYLASLRLSAMLEERSVEEAIDSFHETIALARELAAADPANALARRDLSLAHAAFGDALSNSGDREAALENFRQAQAIQRQLALEDPNNLGHQTDLANSAVRIGYLLDEEGQEVAALASFDEALALRLPLSTADPEDTGNLRDVAVIHSARGDALAELAAASVAGRDPGADRRAGCAAHRESLDLWRELERTEQFREYDRPQLDHAAERVAGCTHPG
jgi:tetratricopeptide (TPR) repeat protein